MTLLFHHTNGLPHFPKWKEPPPIQPQADIVPLPLVAVPPPAAQHGNYAGLSVPQLIAQLHKNDACIARLRACLKRKIDSSRKFKARALNTKTKQKDRRAAEAITAEHRGKKGRWYTPRGGFLLAARRCMSNCAAYSVGLVLMRDLSHPTVTKWEIKFRAALVASSRLFVTTAVEDITHHLVSKQVAGSFCSIRTGVMRPTQMFGRGLSCTSQRSPQPIQGLPCVMTAN